MVTIAFFSMPCPGSYPARRSGRGGADGAGLRRNIRQFSALTTTKNWNRPNLRQLSHDRRRPVFLGGSRCFPYETISLLSRHASFGGKIQTMSSPTPLLDTIKSPEDLRRLPEDSLRQVADELRAETISAVAVTGGHLGAGLGVVELTVALHYVFDTPGDRLVWDVGHQAYPHKILTNRRDRIRTLRQGGGLSGFTKRAESEFDPFGAAHSSTSISAGLGMAVARDLTGRNHNVIAVIGDGAMSAGMAYEAMNNAGAIDSRLIVILNDNNMSIAPPVGALSAYLARLVSGQTYQSVRHSMHQLATHLPPFLEQRAKADGGICPRPGDRRNVVRGTRVLLCRPDRRAQHGAPDPGAEERPRQRNRADPGACRHREGQGLRAGGGVRRPLSRRGQIRRRHRQAGQGQVQRPLLHQGVRREPGQGSRQGPAHRGDHRRDAVRHRRRHFRQGVSRPHLRRRHCRAARRDLRGRARHRGLQAVLRDLLDLPAARLRPDRPRRRDPAPAGAVRARPRRAWSAPTARRMPARSTSPISAACPASC